MNKNVSKVIPLLFILFAFNVFGQNLKTIEKNLIFHHNRISYWHDRWLENSLEVSLDSEEVENKLFKEMLLKYTSTVPASLNYSFDSLKALELFHIITSDDKKFRIYSWNILNTGTMQFFENIIQYKSGKKVFSKLLYRDDKEGDPGCGFAGVYTSSLNNKVCYLATYIAIYSSRDVGEGIRLFTIENNALNDTVKLIKVPIDMEDTINILNTPTEIENQVEYDYDYSSIMNRPNRPSIEYDSVKKTIKVPIVGAHDSVTNEYNEYKFTGKYFEITNQPPQK